MKSSLSLGGENLFINQPPRHELTCPTFIYEIIVGNQSVFEVSSEANINLIGQIGIEYIGIKHTIKKENQFLDSL